MRFPVKSPYRVTQWYHDNYAIDIAPDVAGKTGVEIYAPENGVMRKSEYSRHSPSWPLDNWVILKGDSGRQYYMGHMASRSVPVGQRVVEGQVLGIMGNTGKSSGIHTHLQVRDASNKPIPQLDHWNANSIKVASNQTEQDDDMITDKDIDILRIINSEVKGWDVNDVHSGSLDTREMNAWRGQPIRKLISQGWNESELYRRQKAQNIADIASLKENNRQKDEQIKQLNEALAIEKAKPKGGIDQATSDKIEEINQSVGVIRRLIERIFK